MSAAGTRAFGARLFLVVDGLFFGTVLFTCHSAASRMEAWPDPPAETVPFALPAIAAVLVGLAWLAHQRRASLLLSFASLVVALGTVGLFWHQAAGTGLSWRFTRYGFVVFGVTAAWALHLAGALIALGVQFLRGRSTRETPLVRWFLLWQMLVGFAIVFVVD